MKYLNYLQGDTANLGLCNSCTAYPCVAWFSFLSCSLQPKTYQYVFHVADRIENPLKLIHRREQHLQKSKFLIPWFLCCLELDSCILRYFCVPVESRRVYSHLQRHNFLLIKHLHVDMYIQQCSVPSFRLWNWVSLGSYWAGTSFCLLSQQFVDKISLWPSKSSVCIFIE